MYKPLWKRWWWVPLPALLIGASVPFWPQIERAVNDTAEAPREIVRLPGQALEEPRRKKRRRKAKRRRKSKRKGRNRGKAQWEYVYEDVYEEVEEDEGPGGDEDDVLDPLAGVEISGGGLSSEVDDAMAGLKGRRGGSTGAFDETRGAAEPAESLRVSSRMGRGPVGAGGADLSRSEHHVSSQRANEARGSVPQDVARRVLDGVQKQAQYCYEKELKSHPNIRGKITATFTVQPNGMITAGKLSRSSLGHPPTEQCILRLVKRLRFPADGARDPAPMTYSWQFGGGF